MDRCLLNFHLGLQEWESYLLKPESDISLTAQDRFSSLAKIKKEDEVVLCRKKRSSQYINLVINWDEVLALKDINTISLLTSLHKDWVTQITSENIFDISDAALQIIGSEPE